MQKNKQFRLETSKGSCQETGKNLFFMPNFLVYEKENIRRNAGKGLRQGYADAGPLRKGD